MNLARLLLYYDWKQDPIDRIQIVTGDHDWDEADEINVDSELLTPFYDWEITDMRCELSFIDKSPVLRALIEPVKDATPDRKKRNCYKPSRNAGFSFIFHLFAI